MSRRKYEAVRAELLRDPHRPNKLIALLAGCTRQYVSQVRTALQDAGEIPPRRLRHEAILERLATWEGTGAALARELGVAEQRISEARRYAREHQRVRTIVEKQQ